MRSRVDVVTMTDLCTSDIYSSLLIFQSCAVNDYKHRWCIIRTIIFIMNISGRWPAISTGTYFAALRLRPRSCVAQAQVLMRVPQDYTNGFYWDPMW